jgi:hypothetical protein
MSSVDALRVIAHKFQAISGTQNNSPSGDSFISSSHIQRAHHALRTRSVRTAVIPLYSRHNALGQRGIYTEQYPGKCGESLQGGGGGALLQPLQLLCLCKA